MLKKNDKVIYREDNVKMVGIAISDPYVFVTENKKYIDVYFKNEDLYLPIPTDLLDKVE